MLKMKPVFILMAFLSLLLPYELYSQTVADFQVNENVVDENQVYSAIAVTNNGNFVVVWEDRRRGGDSDTYAQILLSDGTPQGANFRVNSDISYQARDPYIASDNSGNFIIVWWADAIYAQRYSNTGTPIGGNIQVSDGGGNDPRIAMNATDGKFVVTWYDARNDVADIYAQLLASDGTLVGNNFRVNDDTTTSGQYGPNISMDNSGNFVIAWHDSRNSPLPDIYAQRYLSDGTPIGTNFMVSDDTGVFFQSDAVVAMGTGGNFIIAWADQRNGSPSENGGNADIFAQMYSSDGTAIGNNFTVNSNGGNSNEYSPAIAIGEDDKFIILWGSEDDNIYAQHYSDDGMLIGINYRVTNTSNGLQAIPNVKLSNNRVYSTWTDDRTGSTGFDIWANVSNFTPVGINDTSEELAPYTFNLRQNYPNPFNPSTIISYSIAKPGFVKLEIYDVLGNEVQTLVNEYQKSGNYSVNFYAKALPSGVYFYALKMDKSVQTKKMIYMQ